ncbi:MAG: hypothetical protein Q4P25_04020 [Tissierellia bacterium]|nr:hypothetical protein [Tissierellia bacterium]
MRLFLLELKRVFKSIIFWGTTFALIIAITTQIHHESYMFQEPIADQQSYGHYISDDPDYIFHNLIKDLSYSLEVNSFNTYPYGFYREKNLELDEINAIKDIISDLLSIPYEEIDFLRPLSTPDQEKLEYQLNKINAIIGGGSFYAKDKYKFFFGKRELTYERAMQDYQLMGEEGYDVAFARYFNDYAGIFTLLLSWFIGLYFWNKDRKEGIRDTLYVKEASSLNILMSRVLAMSFSLTFILLSLFTYYEMQILRLHDLSVLHPLKAYFLVFIWIFPLFLFTISLSSFINVATSGILLGFLGPIFSLLYMMTSSENIYYHIGYGLLIRYNSIGNPTYFTNMFRVFLSGRIMWIFIGLGVTMITGILYEKRRRGYFAFKNKYSIKSRNKI